MSASRLSLPMSADDFLDWTPPFEQDKRWQLVFGEPVFAMAPPGIDHGVIQANIARLVGSHLERQGRGCFIVVTPGIIPDIDTNDNVRVPDLAVTCTPQRGAKAMIDPLIVFEILSPSNHAQTRQNVLTYKTIPSLAEIVLVSSMGLSAEITRLLPSGRWSRTERVGADGLLALPSIGFEAPLPACYTNSSLV